jgi:hypothetical protein
VPATCKRTQGQNEEVMGTLHDVSPSAVNTGSRIISYVIGQKKLGGVLPSPPSAMVAGQHLSGANITAIAWEGRLHPKCAPE